MAKNPNWARYQPWPEGAHDLDAAEIVRLYSLGHQGAVDSPEHRVRLHTFLGDDSDGREVAHLYEFAGAGAGKLSLPYLAAERLYPGCWPGAAQARGDCVSHGTAHAILVTFGCEIAMESPDEVTGILEGAPEISAEGIKDGVISSESNYWWRGSNGDGWDCPEACEMVIRHAGIWLRKNYPEAGVDLTRYSGKNAGKWGSSRPPHNVEAIGLEHPMRSATDAPDWPTIRDFCAAGFGINTCGGEGFASERDENGVARRSGSWSHSMCVIGADDRATTISKYDCPLALICNSWGPGWIDGPRRIMGTDIDIPEGCFWAKFTDIRRRDFTAFSGAAGWARPRMIDWLGDPNQPVT